MSALFTLFDCYYKRKIIFVKISLTRRNVNKKQLLLFYLRQRAQINNLFFILNFF